MFENIIEFSAPESYVQNEKKEFFPSPIKKNLPEWFKKLKHGFPKKTVLYMVKKTKMRMIKICF